MDWWDVLQLTMVDHENSILFVFYDDGQAIYR